MRHRGFAYPFPLAYAWLDVDGGYPHEAALREWDRLRTGRGIPSIFA